MRQLRSFRDLKGYALLATDGEIGKVEQIYFDDHHWRVRYFVVHTGSWLLGRDVLIVPGMVHGVDEHSQQMTVYLTREQVEGCPPVDSERTVSRHYEIEYHRHYGLPSYWETSSLGMPPPNSPPTPDAGPIPKPTDPHLRDGGEVLGYRIQARDGELGHAHDFIVDDENWNVCYLVVNAGHWWQGRKVLVAPTWIGDVDWATGTISVDLERDAIRTAPIYDPGRIIGHDDEIRLYAHYGKALQAENRPSKQPQEP